LAARPRDRRPRHRARAEGRRLFPRLTVEENLLLGAFRKKARAEIGANRAFCFECFPRLAERRTQLAGSMSGGEQQMLALARAMMQSPRILLIDEPPVGLAPVLVSRTIEKIKELKERYKLTVLMASRLSAALRIADAATSSCTARSLRRPLGRRAQQQHLIKKFYLGL